MTRGRPDLTGIRTALLLLLLLPLCLYLPSLGHTAFADDEIYLAFANRFLRESGWEELYRLFLGPTNPWEFLPARDLSYWLDFRVYGDDLSGFHLTNLLWYAASCIATGLMVKSALTFCRPDWRGRAGVLALVGTAIFAAHPAHVEVAVWIASRKDLMAGTFGALMLWALLAAFDRGFHRDRIAGALLFFLLACLSKASSVTFALLACAVIWAALPRLERYEKRVALHYSAAFLVVCTLSVAVHVSVAAGTGISIPNAPGLQEMIDRASRILTSLGLILVLPYPLRLYHDVYSLGAWHWLVSGALLLVEASGAVAFVRYRRMWGLSVLLIVIPLLPYLQLAPFTTWSLASERFVFLPVAGLALLIADASGHYGRPRQILLGVLLVGACSALIVWQRVGEWEYGRRLLEVEYERQPEFHNAIRDRIVFVLLPEGRYDEAADLARRVGRDYAAHALLALVNAERTFREIDQRIPGGLRAADTSTRKEFCDAISSLTEAIRIGRQRIVREPDVSFNNILRMLERNRDLRFGDWRWMCVRQTPIPS